MTTNKAQAESEKTVHRWRLPLFQGILPLDRAQLLPTLMAGVTLAALNIPQAMGYTKIAGTPVITVGDLSHVWLRAYVNETDLGRVKLNQKVRVTIDTYPGKDYLGRLSFISQQAEFTPKTVQTEKERVKLVYRVKIDIDNPQMELKPGMPSQADIAVE